MEEKVYLKTIISASNEIKYIKMQLRESVSYVDKIIVCEFNRTHSGETRDFIFEKYLKDGTFSEEDKKRIIYVKGDVAKKVKKANGSSDIMHKNEQLFRGYFARHTKLRLNDIIISVDADEIIFQRCYSRILSYFQKRKNVVLQLKLYQFFYKPTYLWVNNVFTAPTVCRVKRNFFRYPAQWRYEGKVLDEIVGCHFSWQLTIDEMIEKLSSYAHAADYGHLANREILTDAIINKKYPFNDKVDFQIRDIDFKLLPEYYPDTYKEFSQEFEYLL